MVKKKKLKECDDRDGESYPQGEANTFLLLTSCLLNTPTKFGESVTLETFSSTDREALSA